MKLSKKLVHSLRIWTFLAVLSVVLSMGFAFGGDLQEVKGKGVLRHLGIPYANFVTGSGDGMDVELMKLFAQQLGVRYEFVETSWENLFGDLTGQKVKPMGNQIEILSNVPIKGDVAANGITVLPWREKVVDYSTPTFPTQVWLVVRADSSVKPIKPSGQIAKDIAMVKKLMKERSVLGVPNTCLDPSLYKIDECGAKPKLFNGNLNEVAPAIMNGEAEMTLLDVPDALIALEKWPGKIKIIGPMVWQVAKAAKIPVIGIGGIMNSDDAIEFFLAGASAIQVGTASFIDPCASVKVLEGIEQYLEKKGFSDIREIVGYINK